MRRMFIESSSSAGRPFVLATIAWHRCSFEP
jgi:hypothetical protein